MTRPLRRQALRARAPFYSLLRNEAVPLDRLLGVDGGDIVGEFIRTRLLPEDEARKNLQRLGLRQAYSDPKLREHRTYKRFISRLVDADILELSLEPNKEQVEMFFVGKKDGRLRMVCDCRRSNQFFREPDKVRLATAESLTRVELDQGSELHIATANLKDAFYHFQLPSPLRKYFGMRSLQAGDLDLTHVGDKPVAATRRIFPRLKVLPMGWSMPCFGVRVYTRRSWKKLGPQRIPA